MPATTLLSRQSWPTLPLTALALTRERIGVAVAAAALFGSVIGVGQGLIERRAGADTPPPAAPVMAVRPIAPAQALKVNAAIPLSDASNPPAEPFRFAGSAAARAQALQCLAEAVYYEAGQEPTDGLRAVAQVVLNRVRHPAFPSSVCGVVYQGSTRATGCQFTFTCDGSLARGPDAAGWRRAKAVAEAALAGSVYAPVGWATHYHADYVVPYWAASLAKNAVVGAHLFYHWQGDWGRSPAFSQAYLGRETSAGTLRASALAAEAATGATADPADLPAAIAEIPGAEAIKLAPSMRGDKRVAVRFKLAAREAADKAVHQPYADKVQASDNLRWTLSGGDSASEQKPLGAPAAESAAASDR